MEKQEKVKSYPKVRFQEETVSEDRTRQYTTGLAASLATLSTGAILGWPSQIFGDLVDGQLGFTMTEDEVGWVCSATSLGAAFLSLFTGGICERFGRKPTMLSLIILLEIGWSLIIFANCLWMLIIGRFITGMVGGAFCVAVPLYIDEIAQKEIRGTMGCFTQLMISVGILFSNIVGYYLDIKQFSSTCAVLPLIFGIVFFFMPETPIYLLEKNRQDQAFQSLTRLRSKKDIGEEFEKMKQSVHLEIKHDVLTAIKLAFGSKANKMACAIALGITVFKVMSGIDAITSYLSHIFDETPTELGPKVGTIIFSTVQVLCVFLQALVVDKWGRKILLILSESIMSVCLLATGISLFLKHHLEGNTDAINYIPLVSLCFFNMAFSLGIGPISWSICAEIFPNEIKGRAMSVCTFCVWFLAFLCVKSYLSIELMWQSYVAFFIFAAMSLLGALFVMIIVPETKNKTYQQIQKELSM